MSAINEVVDLSVSNGIAVLTIDSPPVNALGQAVRSGLIAGFAQALADSTVKAIVLICAGRTFIAGADITEFASGNKEPDLHQVLQDMENATKPVVAAIHGTALGGGLETALCCHYRVCTAAARFGLPEVNLGLLPGAGGTQRLPRVVGVEKALHMMTSGEHITASDALASGLVDDIVSGDLLAGALQFTSKVLTEKRPLVRIRDLDNKLAAARQQPDLFTNFRQSIARKTHGFLAPEYNIRCIEAAVNLPFEQGMAVEQTLFLELMAGPQAAAQQYFFFAERQAGKIPGIAANIAELAIAKVGVIGAGTMGGGIAMNMANAGVPVTIVETQQDALARGLGIIRKNYENTAQRGRLRAEDVEQRCALISGTLDMADLADCDLIIEAVFENMALKKDIFARLDGIAKPGAILASNTSALDLNEIAAATSRPEAVIGLHFFSPANVMKLLEIVRGAKTADNVIKTCMSFAKTIKKTAVLVGVCPGFVGNRILYPRQLQANALILEGALPHEVDKVLLEFGMPMGAFQMSDLAGLDIGWDKARSRGDNIKDRLCEAGRRGQKTGAGFYDYDANRVPQPSPLVEKMILELAAEKGITRRNISGQEILERCLYPMINEGAKILQEGVALRASDIDVTWVYGYGWPVYRGGPMHYADSVGLGTIVAKMQEYRASTGAPVWEPAGLLLELASAGKGFRDFTGTAVARD